MSPYTSDAKGVHRAKLVFLLPFLYSFLPSLLNFVHPSHRCGPPTSITYSYDGYNSHFPQNSCLEGRINLSPSTLGHPSPSKPGLTCPPSKPTTQGKIKTGPYNGVSAHHPDPPPIVTGIFPLPSLLPGFLFCLTLARKWHLRLPLPVRSGMLLGNS